MDFTSQCSHSRPSDPTRLSVFVCRYQGHIGSSLIVGGVDVDGAHLYSVYPHGSYDKLPYLAMGTSAHQHLAGVSAVQLSVRPSVLFLCHATAISNTQSRNLELVPPNQIAPSTKTC